MKHPQTLTAARMTMLTLFGLLPAFGQFTPIDTPTADYTGTTSLVAIPGANGTATSTITSGSLTLTFSPALTVHTVPSGGWSTWNSPPNVETATPKVLGIYTSLTTETITLSSPQTTFGIEIEPDTFSTFSFSLAFMNGTTTLGTVTRNVNGSGGALLFAASSTTPITSVVLTAPAGANGFALAQIRYAGAGGGAPAMATPISTATLFTIAGLLVLGGMWTMRRRGLA